MPLVVIAGGPAGEGVDGGFWRVPALRRGAQVRRGAHICAQPLPGGVGGAQPASDAQSGARGQGRLLLAERGACERASEIALD
eukprot:1837788-Pyramimonas_sp.AAC.3